MSVKAKVEALIYATEEPVTLNQIASLLKDAVLAELNAEEEARLALNEIVSDGKPATEDDDDIAEEQEKVSGEPADVESQPDHLDSKPASPRRTHARTAPGAGEGRLEAG